MHNCSPRAKTNGFFSRDPRKSSTVSIFDEKNVFARKYDNTLNEQSGPDFIGGITFMSRCFFRSPNGSAKVFFHGLV